MTKHTTLRQLLLGMDEGIKEIRELLHNDVDRKAHDNALFTVAKHERCLDDLRKILTNYHLSTAVRVHKTLERMDEEDIPF